jgi:hypothetical protein
MIRCRNCGRDAGPQFCGHCGQSVDEHRESIWRLLGDWLSEWFSLDGQLPRTLAALARPGRLTSLYLDGKRAAYLRPMRLYFIASLLLFGSVLAMPRFDVNCCDVSLAGEVISVASADTGGTRATIGFFDPGPATWAMTTLFSDRFDRLKARSAQEITEVLLEGIRRSLPLMLILFLPVLALALKVLYSRSDALLVDHLVFAVHVQSAIFLSLVLAWLLATLFGLPLVFRLLAAIPVFLVMLFVYLPLALRRAYRQSGGATAAKTVVVIVAYLQVLGAAVSGAQLYALLTL